MRPADKALEQTPRERGVLSISDGRSSAPGRWARSVEVRVIVRPETARDVAAIRELDILAFQGHPCSRQSEHLIVEASRAAGALESSLVAESDVEVMGHIAFSAAGVGVGFRQFPGVTWHGVPDENVLCRLLSGEMPIGGVAYHPVYLAGT